MDYEPYSKDSMIRSHNSVLNSNNYNREILRKTLLNYNTKIGNNADSLENCKKISRKEVTVIITGQQAGIFGGPAYTIYKIITAINLSKFYSAKLNLPVIPIFWHATEDHDIDEIATLHYPNKKWASNPQHSGTAVERLKTSNFCRRLISDYLAEISLVNHKTEIERIVSPDHSSYGEYASSVLARLFRGNGLIMIEPKHLRIWNRDFFQKCISLRHEINDILKSSADKLIKYGIEPTFKSIKDHTGLFYINERGIRRRIIYRDNHYLVGDNDFSEGALFEHIQRYTKRFSTSAYLRPVFQAWNFPNIAYVAGPAEFAYHLQIREIYHLFGLTMPVIRLRNHATIFTRKNQKVVKKLKLTESDFSKTPTNFHNSQNLPERYERRLEKAQDEYRKGSLYLLKPESDVISPNRVEAFSARIHFEFEKFRKGIYKDYLRKLEIDNARIDHLYRCIRPYGKPQERVINILYFIELNGINLIKELIGILDPFESKHYYIYTDN